MLPLIVSFYTKDTPYEMEVQNLLASLQRFSLAHEVEGITSAGSWELNCAFKPLFILRKLEKANRPLLWVDADAVFVREPEPLRIEADLGVRLYDCSNQDRSRIVSATLWINPTPSAKRIVSMWAEECLAMLQEENRKEEVWDQDALRRVLFERDHGGTFEPLPVAYSKIYDHPQDGRECPSPIIVQNQASRRYKRWISDPAVRFFSL